MRISAPGASSAATRFLAAFTEDLVDLELGPVSPELRDRARQWVVARVGNAGDVARLGLTVAGTALAVGVRIRTGRSYDRLAPQRRSELARRLAGSRLPIAAEYVKAVRSLAVAYVFEARYATAP